MEKDFVEVDYAFHASRSSILVHSLDSVLDSRVLGHFAQVPLDNPANEHHDQELDSQHHGRDNDHCPVAVINFLVRRGQSIFRLDARLALGLNRGPVIMSNNDYTANRQGQYQCGQHPPQNRKDLGDLD